MKYFNVSSNIVPIGEFKMRISKWLKNVQSTGQPVVITQNGKPAGVLLSPAEFDDLTHQKMFIDSVNRGLADLESGNVYGTDQVKKELSGRRAHRNSK